MASPSFYWHDYETWGINPALDRPSQFAGIRTDEHLNIIGEPLVIYCQPAPDMLPHPQACLVTGITPQHAAEHGLPEHEFIAQIHAELSAPNTCGAGYNSIRFDDEFTRFTLYRNFYDPYAREWQNGNSRWDLIDVVRLCAALRPEGINWPMREDGTPSFKLEELSAANGLEHESAHDALSDVIATIDLARLIKFKQPKLFEYAMKMRKKQAVQQTLDVFSQKPVFHVSGKIPAAKHCSALMMPLTQHPVNKNATICFDLSQDPSDLIKLDVEGIAKRFYVANADLKEGESRIALKEIHANKSPMVATSALLDDGTAERLGIDKMRCKAHWQMLREATGLSSKIKQLFEQSSFEPRTDPDAMLYDGFFSNQDRALMQQVLSTDAEDLATQSFPFRDKRLPELFFRYRARNFPETLSPDEAALWQEHCHQRLNNADAGGTLTIAAMREEVAKLKPDLPLEKQAVLESALAWAEAAASG